MNSSSIQATNYVRPLIGFLIWLSFVFVAPRTSAGLLETIENLLLLAILALVPLGLSTLLEQTKTANIRLLYSQILRIQPFAALSALCAFLLPQGWLAGLLTLPWLGLTIYFGIRRLRQIWRDKIDNTAQLWSDAGIAYLAVGAGWLLLTRSGIRPLDFSAVIVLLTAVHFHYTGFLVPILLAHTDRFLRMHQRHGWLDLSIAIGIVASMPIIAAGITISPLIELIGVSILYAAIVLFAITLGLRVAKFTDSGISRWLLRISAAAMIFAISCALLYGIGEFLHMQLITLPRMVQLHGFTNAFGFILSGLLAYAHERSSYHLSFANFRSLTSMWSKKPSSQNF